MKKRILLLEDEIGNQRILNFILGRNFQLVIVGNGQEAFSWLETHRPPDLIIMDWIMPVMDGKSFLQKLKAYECLHHIPVIVLSSHEFIQEELQTVAFKTDFQLSKPVDPRVLRSAVDSAMYPMA